MPMIYLCDLHSGSPHDTIFSIIDPDKIGTENELHFEWAIAQIKARFTSPSYISVEFIFIKDLKKRRYNNQNCIL